MSYLYSMSVAAGGETRHAATNKAVPVMHTGNSCRDVRKGCGQRMDSSKQAKRELLVKGQCPSRPGRLTGRSVGIRLLCRSAAVRV
jgi:hypothetical protein